MEGGSTPKLRDTKTRLWAKILAEFRTAAGVTDDETAPKRSDTLRVLRKKVNEVLSG